MRTLMDLLLPWECGGCGSPGAPGTPWCGRCLAVMELAEPSALRPRVDGVPPAWAAGPYADPWRRAVIATKERGRRDLARPLGVVLARAVRTLREWGELDGPELSALALVVAPGRARAARARGGDPVARIVAACAEELGCDGEAVTVHRVLRTHRRARDSVGLGAVARSRNLAGRVLLRGRVPGPDANVVLVDDVLTTGATAAASVQTLRRHGVTVRGVLVVAGVR